MLSGKLRSSQSLLQSISNRFPTIADDYELYIQVLLHTTACLPLLSRVLEHSRGDALQNALCLELLHRNKASAPGFAIISMKLTSPIQLLHDGAAHLRF